MSVKTLVMLAVGLVLLYLLFTAGAPFLLALVVAIFIDPLTQLLMRRLKLKRIIASTISSTIFTLILIGLIALLGVKVFAELTAFLKRAPEYAQELSAYLQTAMDNAQASYQNLPPDVVAQIESWTSQLAEGLGRLLNGVSGWFLGIAAGIPNFFIFFIVFLVAVYMFGFSLDTMKASFLSLFDPDSRGKVSSVLDNLRRSIFGFIRSQLILSALTYVITLAGLLVLGVKFPLAIALLVCIVDVLPILGTGSVLVPWAAYLLLVSGNLYQGLGLIVLFLFITVFRRIVEPKVLGDAVGIGALSALISLYVGFKLVGVIGVFLGPLVVIIYMAARKAGLFETKIRL